MFGRELRYTPVAKTDSIAVAANLLMGEAAESTPFVIVRGAKADFTDKKIDSIQEQSIDDELCIFRPLFKE